MLTFRSRPFFIFCIFAIVWISSCQRQPTQTVVETLPTATPIPSATPKATTTPKPSSTAAATLAPTDTPTVTATATATATPTARPTLTPRPTATTTPTAVPTLTPAASLSQSSAYQLKEWTEQDALDLISEMRTQIDPIDWNSEFHYSVEINNFQFSHRPLELAAYEAGLRFPESEHRLLFDWNLALALALRDMPKTDPTELIVQLLENGLNEGIYNPEAWTNGVNHFDFSIKRIAQVNNLFGDGRTIPIFKIETIFSGGDDGLFFALDGNADSTFDVIPIQQFWHEGNGYIGERPQISDHTGDGMPEFVNEARFQSGTICLTGILVRQWQDDQFINLAEQPDGETILLPHCPDKWQFLPAAEGEAQPIQVQLIFGISDQTSMEQIYQWDQSRYALHDTIIRPLLPDDPINWINFNIDTKNYITATQAIEALLNQQSSQLPGNSGPSYPDFLRFQQGWLYALDGQLVKSQESFLYLIDTPVNSFTPTLSLAAQSFLDYYHTETDIYTACSAAQQVMLNALETPSNNNGSTSNYMQAWGYAGHYNLPCDLDDAWQFLFQQTQSIGPEETIAYLEGAGASIIDKQSKDLNEDGRLEWLLTLESTNTYGDTTYPTWILFETDTGLAFKAFGISPDEVIHWETIKPPGNDFPLHFIQTDKSLNIFRFDNSFGIKWYQFQELNFNVNNFSLDIQNDILTLTVYFDDSPVSLRQLVFRWNPVLEDFEVVATDIPHYLIPSEYQIPEGARRLLFIEKNYAAAVEMLTYAQAHYPNQWPNEVSYLLGLAYELVGDEEKAVEAYWQLWRDHPDTVYALMARRKLVPVAP